MPARLTDTARRQGWKNAAIVVPTLLLAVWILGKLLSLIYGQDRIDTQRFAFLGSWGLILLISLVRWIYGKAIGGKVLLDCGRFPGKWGYLVVGVVIGFLCCSASIFTVGGVEH